MKRILSFIMAILFVGGGFFVSGHTQTLSGLSTRPLDSAEAERVRIWIPVERENKCRVKVDILDDSDKVIRHLIDYLPSAGYYNFYWDKRDDSGRQVPPGTYKSLVNNCGHIQVRPIIAQYSKWEKASYIAPMDTTRPFLIRLKLLEDSALVSMRVYTAGGRRQLDSVVVDTMLMKGTHDLEWHAPYPVSRGNYAIRVWIGDYIYNREFTYLP